MKERGLPVEGANLHDLQGALWVKLIPFNQLIHIF
jgi:hypothetical protein